MEGIFLHIGLVDLDDGELLWTNSVRSGSLNLRDEQNVTTVIAKIFESYPSE